VTGFVYEILQHKDFVCPIDVFIKFDYLKNDDYENWRFGRFPYLEKVILCNLSNANRILRILRLHAEDIGLKESRTIYNKWGKGKNKIVLRFSNNRDQNVDISYSTHYVKKQRIAEKSNKNSHDQNPETLNPSDIEDELPD